MLTAFDLDNFIRQYVTRRPQSLLQNDFDSYSNDLDNQISHKKVLVIGGAGSIGSHYIKALLRYRVAALIVVDINENGLTELVRDLRSSTHLNIPDVFMTYPVDFGDAVFRQIFHHYGPFDIVANFAAHKHVRSEKDIFSVQAMLANNVFKARGLLDLLREAKPEHFFCVSTDKAANPVNIMGASKKLLEGLILAYTSEFTVTTARFANVAFSNGSLPLGFLERLHKRQPWACPSDIRRFFVSPQEAGELCLLASVLGSSGDIFFPKLDAKQDILSFKQIALDLLAVLGLEPDFCDSEAGAREKAAKMPANPTQWPLYLFESDTSGEKPYEEFYTHDEELDLDAFHELGVIKNTPGLNFGVLTQIVSEFQEAFSRRDTTKQDIVDILNKYLPTFSHIETGKFLDAKM